MKKTILTFSIIAATGILLSSCGGNVTEVTIGSQVWMTKNLDVSTFRNGDPIPQAKTNEEWIRASENKHPAWCYYDNDPANGAKYGKLYNWYAVNDPRGLAPVGYHVPSDKEWWELEWFLGTYEGITYGTDHGITMKSTSGWNEDGNGTDSSGFSGLPGGLRDGDDDGAFYSVGKFGLWWSSTGSLKYYPWYRSLNFRNGYVNRAGHYWGSGLSVRCLRD